MSPRTSKTTSGQWKERIITPIKQHKIISACSFVVVLTVIVGLFFVGAGDDNKPTQSSDTTNSAKQSTPTKDTAATNKEIDQSIKEVENTLDNDADFNQIDSQLNEL